MFDCFVIFCIYIVYVALWCAVVCLRAILWVVRFRIIVYCVCLTWLFWFSLYIWFACCLGFAFLVVCWRVVFC